MAGARKRFCGEEDETIIQIVAEKDNYKRVKENGFWEEAAKHPHLLGHPPLSCRNRFHRHILTNIDLYDDVPEKVRKLSTHGTNKTQATLKALRKSTYYSTGDDMKIIDYITNKGGSWKSLTFWKDCDLKLAVPRSADSLRGRAKLIMRNLSRYKLSKEQLALLETASIPRTRQSRLEDYMTKKDSSESDAESSADDVVEIRSSDSEGHAGKPKYSRQENQETPSVEKTETNMEKAVGGDGLMPSATTSTTSGNPTSGPTSLTPVYVQCEDTSGESERKSEGEPQCAKKSPNICRRTETPADDVQKYMLLFEKTIEKMRSYNGGNEKIEQTVLASVECVHVMYALLNRPGQQCDTKTKLQNVISFLRSEKDYELRGVKLMMDSISENYRKFKCLNKIIHEKELTSSADLQNNLQTDG